MSRQFICRWSFYPQEDSPNHEPRKLLISVANGRGNTQNENGKSPLFSFSWHSQNPLVKYPLESSARVTQAISLLRTLRRDLSEPKNSLPETRGCLSCVGLFENCTRFDLGLGVDRNWEIGDELFLDF